VSDKRRKPKVVPAETGDAVDYLEQIDRMNKDNNELFQRIMEGNAGIQTEVKVLSGNVSEQSTKIEKLGNEVSDLRIEVARQPLEWNVDIDAKIEKNNRKRNEIGEAIEKARGQKYDVTRGASVTPPSRSHGSIKISSLLQSMLPYILIGLAAIGAFVASKLGGPDGDDLGEAIEAIHDVQQQVEKINGQEVKFQPASPPYYRSPTSQTTDPAKNDGAPRQNGGPRLTPGDR
jgi:hypothetical protein